METRFWAELVCGFNLGKAAAGRSTRQAENKGLASDPGMLIYVFFFMKFKEYDVL